MSALPDFRHRTHQAGVDRRAAPGCTPERARAPSRAR
jgi:hypothetical protein